MSTNQDPDGSTAYHGSSGNKGTLVQDEVKDGNRLRHLPDQLLHFVSAGYQVHAHAFIER